MSLINLSETAAALPRAWQSSALGLAGAATVKVLRMDGLAAEPETHEGAEALLVIDGVLELEVAGRPVSVHAGELYLVPPGTPHSVRAGSRGTLVIVE